jgi:hypothetical protein
MSNQALTDDSWKRLAKSLEVEAAALRAVAAVEAAGSGFLPNDPTRPKVLFEGHAFHRLTGGRFATQRPDLSYAKWDRTKYSGTLKGEWARLEAACNLDRAAALQAASWGMFQIMGFNYAYCGCPDVEAFVALQHAGADKQMECFARFVARPPYLAALQAKDWVAFAKAYNGPQHAKNNYAPKMAAAHATFATAPRAARKRKRLSKTAAADSALPPGRATFVPVGATRKRTVRKRNVRPDSVDLRDWEYRPSIAFAPRDELWSNPRKVKQQDDTNACTGFSLATVLEYLLERRTPGKRAEDISGFMLYSMARRYDEWAEEDENEDSGSSLRGALKGWAKHGASREDLWDKLPMPPVPKNPANDWWLDGVKRPLGAYYRIAPENVRDIHVALSEVGAVYASALTHEGWDDVLRETKGQRPKDPGRLPVVKAARGDADQGHAFAIVGYTRTGFIVHNSWGEEWGAGGFAVLPYEDWLRNAMDCWVVQLGVPTVEHDEVAKAKTLRVERSGRAVVSSNETLADHEVSPFAERDVNVAHVLRCNAVIGTERPLDAVEPPVVRRILRHGRHRQLVPKVFPAGAVLRPSFQSAAQRRAAILVLILLGPLVVASRHAVEHEPGDVLGSFSRRAPLEQVLEHGGQREAGTRVRVVLLLDLARVRPELVARRKRDRRPVLPVAQIDGIGAHVALADGALARRGYGHERRSTRGQRTVGRSRLAQALPLARCPRRRRESRVGSRHLGRVVVLRVLRTVVCLGERHPVLRLQRRQVRRSSGQPQYA